VLEIDVEPAGASVSLFPFYVDRVTIVETTGVPRAVLGIRAWSQSDLEGALGKTNSGVLGVTFGGTPTLVLDNIEQNGVVRLVRILGDSATLASELLLTPTGAVLKADVRRALGADADVATRVARLLVERDRLLAAWPRSELAVASRSGGAAAARMVEIEHELARMQAPRVIARLTELLGHAVALHEAQHATDYERATPLAEPAGLEVVVPADRASDVATNVASATSELSAYLSSVAHDHVAPQVELWEAVSTVIDFDDAPVGSAYGAAFMIRELARYFGDTSDPFAQPGKIDALVLAKLTNELTGRTKQELSAAAAAVWQRLFGEPLAEAHVRGAPGP
jgi:hypothetical protein